MSPFSFWSCVLFHSCDKNDTIGGKSTVPYLFSFWSLGGNNSVPEFFFRSIASFFHGSTPLVGTRVEMTSWGSRVDHCTSERGQAIAPWPKEGRNKLSWEPHWRRIWHKKQGRRRNGKSQKWSKGEEERAHTCATLSSFFDWNTLSHQNIVSHQINYFQRTRFGVNQQDVNGSHY